MKPQKTHKGPRFLSESRIREKEEKNHREREVRCVEVEDKDAEMSRDRGEEKGFECYRDTA
jgi:hypothetical protein